MSGGGRRGVRLVETGEVPALLSMDTCIEAVEEAFRAHARNEVIQPLRTVVQLPDGRSSFLVMPALQGRPASLGAKLLTLFPDNHERGIESHQGVIVLFDARTGSPKAVVDAAPVTAIRTAAASGVATRALARADASDLGILGSGVQARSHLEAVLAVRRIRTVRAWSPTRAHLSGFVEEARARHGVAVEAVDSAREAVEGADVVCAVTASPTPVLQGAWLAPGVHVNAVGASTPETRELDTDAVVRSRFYVDSREGALAEAGDLLIPRAEGAVTEDHVLGELGEVLEGRVEGRLHEGDVTVFKSLGMAVQDLAATERLLGALEGRDG